MTTSHLSIVSIEALANRRDDLVTPIDRVHATECPQCTQAITFTRMESAAISRVVESSRADVPALDLQIARALRQVPAPRSSSRSIAIATALGLAAAIVFVPTAWRQMFSVTAVFSQVHRSASLATSLARVIARVVPGGVITTGYVGVAMLLLLLIPLRRLIARAPAQEVSQ